MEENEAKNDIQITEDVVSVIAGIAMKDIEGVAKVAAGFAGGIISAAVDGIKVSEKIMQKFKID